MQLVSWYLQFVRRAAPGTWSLEEVNHRVLRAHLLEHEVCFRIFPFVRFGVPQTRTRTDS